MRPHWKVKHRWKGTLNYVKKPLWGPEAIQPIQWTDSTRQLDLEIAKLKRSLWITQALVRIVHFLECGNNISCRHAYRDRIWLSICVIRVFIFRVLPFASVAIRFRATPCWIEILPAHDARTILNYIVQLIGKSIQCQGVSWMCC